MRVPVTPGCLSSLVPRLKDRLALVFSTAPLIAASAVIALSLAACGSGASDPPPTAEQIVNVWFLPSYGGSTSEKVRFCTEYARGPELALKQFEEDSEELEAYPSAREIFDEAASRC
jgi:hypothetical protein